MAESEAAPRGKKSIPILRLVVLALVGLMLVLTVLLVAANRAGLFRPAGPLQVSQPSPSDTPTPSPSATGVFEQPPPTVQPSPPPPTAAPPLVSNLPGAAFLSIVEAGHAHLFAFLPAEQRLVRLTMGDWDDITPAASPDGKRLAFASNRSGFWNLYLMSLEDGALQQISASPEYKAAPSWSPDGLWLAYEAYLASAEAGDLEILIRPVDGSQEPVRLTESSGADYAPAWSPGGRTIAFVSSRSGDLEIWLADLDKEGDRFQNLSREPFTQQNHPDWSPDGSRLAWSSSGPDGVESLYLWSAGQPDLAAVRLESASWPAWGPDGAHLLAAYRTPNQTYLTGYRLADQRAILPLLSLQGDLRGLSWGKEPLSAAFLEQFSGLDESSIPPLWEPLRQVGQGSEPGRAAIVNLDGVQAPVAMLHDDVNEAFQALRARLTQAIGWDYLSILEQAYVPLTSALEPGFQEDWLFTGRAIRTNTAPLQAGWLKIVQERYGAELYWRVYLRARYQDGSQGMPLKSQTFDLSARLSGDVLAYESGGMLESQIPPGYWLDFTSLAGSYGWERMAALTSWRTSFSGVRFNEFVLRQGLDWFSAMLQLYPREALNTPTRVLSPTPTPTVTNTFTPTITLTRTPYLSKTPTPTSTRRPTLTWTPKPGGN